MTRHAKDSHVDAPCPKRTGNRIQGFLCTIIRFVMGQFEWRKLVRCATPWCPYLVHDEGEFGGYCCRRCHVCHGHGRQLRGAPPHGRLCQMKIGGCICMDRAVANAPSNPMTTELFRIALPSHSAASNHSNTVVDATSEDQGAPRP